MEQMSVLACQVELSYKLQPTWTNKTIKATTVPAVIRSETCPGYKWIWLKYSHKLQEINTWAVTVIANSASEPYKLHAIDNRTKESRKLLGITLDAMVPCQAEIIHYKCNPAENYWPRIV